MLKHNIYDMIVVVFRDNVSIGEKRRLVVFDKISVLAKYNGV